MLKFLKGPFVVSFALSCLIGLLFYAMTWAGISMPLRLWVYGTLNFFLGAWAVKASAQPGKI